VFNISSGAVTTRRYVDILARIVGKEPDIVEVPDSRLHELPPGSFGHLFSWRHHAVLSIDKARHLLGYEPRYDIRAGHAHTYKWFLHQGYDLIEGSLSDPVWRSTWNFAAEETAARILRG
jgi:nucleoside-diphosphate-sugar epimerase